MHLTLKTCKLHTIQDNITRIKQTLQNCLLWLLFCVHFKLRASDREGQISCTKTLYNCSGKTKQVYKTVNLYLIADLRQ